MNLVKETVVGRWKQSQDLCIWTHCLNPVHFPGADTQAGLQNCLPLPMKYLTLNLSEESKAVKSQESPHTPALEQKLPSLQLKKTKQGAWEQDQKKGQWDSVMKLSHERGTEGSGYRKLNKFLDTLSPPQAHFSGPSVTSRIYVGSLPVLYLTSKASLYLPEAYDIHSTGWDVVLESKVETEHNPALLVGGKEKHSLSRESDDGMGVGCLPKPCQKFI